MSSTLYWEPTRDPEKYVCDTMKYILKSRNDGDLNCSLGEYDLEFLSGVFHTSSGQTKKDAMSMIKAIQKHGSIQLKEVF